MKSNDLIDIIGEAADEHIRDAKSAKKKKMPRWTKWFSAIAVCFILVAGIGGFLFPRMGGSSGGAGGHEEGSTFMSYAGPVFPLTLLEANDTISAERNITMDFAPWVPVWVSNEEKAAELTNISEEERQEALAEFYEWYPEGGYYKSSGNIIVTDSYTLTNGGTTAQTVSVLYPFASNLNSLNETRPTLSIDGNALDTTLHIGTYAGGFQGAWENWAETGENPGSLNLQHIESWEGYQALLADGSYLQKALGDFVDLSDIPVTVYEFTDAWGPEADNDAGIPNPTIRVTFELDYDKTKVLAYGFHSGSYDRENNMMGRGFSIREEHERYYGVPYYLIVVGDDIENIEWQGYVTGGWDTKETVEAGVTITRTESDLETALRTAAQLYYLELNDAGNYFGYETEYGFELYFGLMKEHLISYGVLAKNTAERYDGGSIENLDVVGVSRVCWLETEITIPAGASVTLNAVLKKEPSYDFHCANTENKGVSGYDTVTNLGSNLRFTQQTARLEDRGQIEIVRQNFGFDLANGINEVELDVNNPHYYLEVRSAESHD